VRPRRQPRGRRGVGRRVVGLGTLGLAGLDVGRALRDVLRQVDERRALAAVAGERERFADVGADGVGAGREVVAFGDRCRHADGVGLLEGVVPDELGRDLAGEREHGVGVHVRVRQPGDEVRRAGARGRETDAGVTGDDPVRVGGVGGALLVRHRDVVDARVVERVVDGHDRAALHAERGLDAGVLEGADDRLRAVLYGLRRGLLFFVGRFGVRVSGRLGRGFGWVCWSLLGHRYGPPVGSVYMRCGRLTAGRERYGRNWGEGMMGASTPLRYE